MTKMLLAPYGRSKVETPYSKTGGVSKAVPNQALSVREILARFARGTPPHVREASYDDEYVPDLAGMDLVEIEQYRESLRERVDAIQAELNAYREARNSQKDDATESGEKDRNDSTTGDKE